MAEDNNLVKLVRPDGKTMNLGEAVNCSAQFHDTLRYCKQYKTRKYMECTCGMDQQSAEK